MFTLSPNTEHFQSIEKIDLDQPIDDIRYATLNN